MKMNLTEDKAKNREAVANYGYHHFRFRRLNFIVKFNHVNTAMFKRKYMPCQNNSNVYRRILVRMCENRNEM